MLPPAPSLPRMDTLPACIRIPPDIVLFTTKHLAIAHGYPQPAGNRVPVTLRERCGFNELPTPLQTACIVTSDAFTQNYTPTQALALAHQAKTLPGGGGVELPSNALHSRGNLCQQTLYWKTSTRATSSVRVENEETLGH